MVSVLAGCSRTVTAFLTCQQVSVPCTCSNGLHGLEGCSNGKTTGQCLCVPPVTPVITIAGSPGALTSGASYTATVAPVAGLTYLWGLSGGTATTPTNEATFGFIAGGLGVVLLTVEVSNSGGDRATPAQLATTVVQAPAQLSDSDVFVPPTLTEFRGSIPARIVSPLAGLTYVWSQTGGASIDATGAQVRLASAGPGTMTVQVYAQNSAGAQSQPITKTIAVVARQIELVGGQPGGPGSLDGPGVRARFGGSMGLAADGAGNVFVNDQFNDIVRRIDASGTVTTLAGELGVSEIANGTGVAAHFMQAVIDYASNSLVVVQTDGVCSIASLTHLTNGQSTLASVAACANSITAVQSVSVDGAAHAYLLANNQDIYVFTVGSPAAPVALTVAPALYSPQQLIASSTANKLILIDKDGSSVPNSIKILTKAGAQWNAVAFDSPCADQTNALATDAAGNVYVACAGSIYASTGAPAQTVAFSRIAGASDDLGAAVQLDGAAATATFVGPSALVVSNGVLFVADGTLVRTVVLSGTDRGKVATVAGSITHAGHQDGPDAKRAQFTYVQSVVVDADDTLHVLESPAALGEDGFLGTVTAPVCDIREVAVSGNVTTQVGSGCGKEKNGSWALSQLALPIQMAGGPDGSLFLTNNFSGSGMSSVHDIVQVRAEGFVTRTAGASGSQPKQIDGFAANAGLRYPQSLAVAPDGSVVFADSDHTSNFTGTIRLIIDNNVITVAGDENGNYGPLESDHIFAAPSAVAIDAQHHIYAAAKALTAHSVGIESTIIFSLVGPNFVPQFVAGARDNCLPVASEACETACIRSVTALALQPQSNQLYFADGELVRRIAYGTDGSCKVEIVAGRAGEAGIAPAPLASATLNFLSGMAFSPSTLDLFAADSAENVIVRIRY